MDISIRSCLTAGVATITAAAIAFVPSVEEPAPAARATSAGSRRVAADTTHRTGAAVGHGDRPAEPPRRVVATDRGAAERRPTRPDAPVPAGGRAHVHRQQHQNVYNAVEPWVQWGFDLAAYAVGWVPYVGWLAPQITIFYNFGERIVAQHHVQHRRLARREHQLRPGLGQRRRRHHQLVHLPGQRPTRTSGCRHCRRFRRYRRFNSPFAASQATTEPTVAAATEDVTTAAADPDRDNARLNEKHIAVEDEELAAAPDEEAASRPDEQAAAPNERSPT